MRRMAGCCALVVMVAPLLGSSLHAQQTREQAMIFGEEPVLDPMRKTLKAEVLVLRDTLYAVDAVSARLVRAKIGGQPSVVVSSARSLRVECSRSVRAATVMRGQMAAVGTNDARGKRVIADYNKSLDELKKSMLRCDTSLETALSSLTTPEVEPLFRAALASADAVKKYEAQLSVLLKTLQIPVDPKGFRSAIEM